MAVESVDVRTQVERAAMWRAIDKLLRVSGVCVYDGGLKGNSRTFKRARELARSAKDFSEALDLWEDAGIRYHYYCRTD